MRRIVAMLLAMCMLGACSPQPVEETVENTPPVPEESTVEEVEETLSIYEEDALYLVETIEETHPCFVLDDVPEGYEEAKAEYLEAVGNIQSDKEFYFVSMKYTSLFQDGHTSLGTSSAGISKVLNLKSLWHEGEQWLIDENAALTDTKVLAIGGVSIDEIWEVYRQYFPMENNGAYYLYRDALRYDSYLETVGVDVSADKIDVLLEKDGQQYTESYEFLPLNDYIATEQSQQETIRYEMIDDVFYIDMNKCVVDDNLKVVAATLTDAVANGQQKVIIDVRGNSGGDNQACMQLLKAMNMKEPICGQFTRISGTDVISKRSEPDTKSVKNPDIQFIVLSDEDVFSSANSLCLWVQDGDLGLVIGRPSSNAPNAYGNVRYLTLPNTEIAYRVSMDYWIRPNVNADATTLEMDIELPFGTDALAVALEILAE